MGPLLEAKVLESASDDINARVRVCENQNPLPGTDVFRSSGYQGDHLSEEMGFADSRRSKHGGWESRDKVSSAVVRGAHALSSRSVSSASAVP
ncbi:hypothetical protein Kisp01_70130 [Kineosporia sp. NBRC 101677]|nr:hypothetical protein Kisp01_70130 [Kineosporia sp. NBRC 101677]